MPWPPFSKPTKLMQMFGVRVADDDVVICNVFWPRISAAHIISIERINPCLDTVHRRTVAFLIFRSPGAVILGQKENAWMRVEHCEQRYCCANKVATENHQNPI